jgi:hypothetical protein
MQEAQLRRYVRRRVLLPGFLVLRSNDVDHVFCFFSPLCVPVSECSKCYGWKKQITRARVAAKKASR